MVHAKNYETVSTFVKVMQKKPWPLFSWTRCRNDYMVKILQRNDPSNPSQSFCCQAHENFPKSSRNMELITLLHLTHYKTLSKKISVESTFANLAPTRQSSS